MREIRASATTRPRISTAISTITNSFTSSQNPRRTSGNESLKSVGLKNVSRTFGQPSLVTTTVTSRPSTTTVETAETAS